MNMRNADFFSFKEWYISKLRLMSILWRPEEVTSPYCMNSCKRNIKKNFVPCCLFISLFNSLQSFPSISWTLSLAVKSSNQLLFSVFLLTAVRLPNTLQVVSLHTLILSVFHDFTFEFGAFYWIFLLFCISWNKNVSVFPQNIS